MLIRWSKEEEEEKGAARTNARNILTRLRARHSFILDLELMVLRNRTREPGTRMRGEHEQPRKVAGSSSGAHVAGSGMSVLYAVGGKGVDGGGDGP